MSAHPRIQIAGDGVIDPTTAGLRLPEPEILRMAPELLAAEAIDCPSCGGSSFRRAARNDRYGFPLDYVSCEGCGLLFANPYYDQPSLDRFYSRHYASIYGRTAHPENAFRAEKQRGRAVLRLVERHQQKQGLKFGSAIDIGCSHGGFLGAFPANWQRVGFDYDENLFALGRTRGLELNSIHGLEGEKRKFDLVMANQVVEHTRDPIEFLVRLRGLLSERGVIYVEVPGLRAPQVADIDYRLMFKNAHRFLFEARTFELCAARAGLRAEYLDESVRALLRPGGDAALAGAVRGAPATETIEFVRAKVASWRPPGLLSRTLGKLRRIPAAVARRLGAD